MPVPNTFANATTSIPLSQLDANFATAITLGNTAIQLGNTVTTLNNMTLANVTVSTGNVSFTQGTIGGNVVINTTGTANTGNHAVTGTLSASTGIEQYRNSNATSYIRVANDSTGAAADSYFYAQNSTTTLFMGLPSTGYTTSGIKVAGQAYIYHDGAGGLSIGATNGAGALRFYAGGTTKVGEFTSTGLAVTGSSGVSTTVSGGATGTFYADANFVYLQNSNTAFATPEFISMRAATNTMNLGVNGATKLSLTTTGAAVTGSLSCTGALSKGSGSFRISHPLPELSETHQLVHSFIEGPKADLIYRGKVNLVNGAATVNIDEVSGMTDGTFSALCRDVQCFTTNESDWTPVRGSVAGNVLTIEAQDNTSTSSVSWMVIGERKDQHMYETDWTDDNGRVIVEPLKPVVVEVTE